MIFMKIEQFLGLQNEFLKYPINLNLTKIVGVHGDVCLVVQGDYILILDVVPSNICSKELVYPFLLRLNNF